MNSVHKQYFQEIKNALNCSARLKNRCVMEYNDGILTLLEQNPNATLEDLYENFGDPEDIAEAFLECLSPEQFSKKLSVRRKIVIGVISIVALLAITLSVVSIVFAEDIHDFHEGYDVEIYKEIPIIHPTPVTTN